MLTWLQTMMKKEMGKRLQMIRSAMFRMKGPLRLALKTGKEDIYIVLKSQRQEELGPDTEVTSIYTNLHEANEAARDEIVEFPDDSDWSISENEEEDETLHITARYRIYDEEWNAWVVKKVITGLDSTEQHAIVHLILHDHQDQTAGDPDTKVWGCYSGLVEANYWARCHLDLCNDGDHKIEGIRI